MSTGAKNICLYYTISLRQNQGPHKNCMHHTLTYFNSKSVKNPYFCIYFQCEKLTGNEIFLGWYISVHLFTLIYHLGLIEDIYYLVSIILDNIINFHVHTAICLLVISVFW